MVNRDYPTDQHREPSQSALPPPVTVSALVLCGGAGRRLGGIDKGLIEMHGQPAVQRCASLLEPLCGQLFISANRNLGHYRGLELGEVIPDLRTGFPGPLAALETVGRRLQTPFLLLLPCDLPLLCAEIPAALLAALYEKDDADVVYAQSDNDDESAIPGRSDNHYLCAALRRDSLDSLGSFMDGGGRAVRGWYASLRSRPIRFSGPLAEGFFNVNSEADLAAIAQRSDKR